MCSHQMWPAISISQSTIIVLSCPPCLNILSCPVSSCWQYQLLSHASTFIKSSDNKSREKKSGNPKWQPVTCAPCTRVHKLRARSKEKHKKIQSRDSVTKLAWINGWEGICPAFRICSTPVNSFTYPVSAGRGQCWARRRTERRTALPGSRPRPCGWHPDRAWENREHGMSLSSTHPRDRQQDKQLSEDDRK